MHLLMNLKHGLKNFDVIKEVNGMTVNSPETAYSGINTIGESDKLSLAVDRDGEMITVEVNK